MIVCLQLDAIGKRVAFNVTVDTYTALKATGVYDAMKAQTTASISLQFKNALMTSGYLQSGNSIAQLYSFVIRTDKGVVTGIESDNAAYANAGCVDSSAITVNGDKNCFRTLDPNAGSINDPHILLSWIGTDSTGAYMLSQTRRISRFSQFSLDNVYSSILSVFQ